MKVMFDTNILMSDFNMKGHQFQIFLKGYEKIPAEIMIPQIVIDELSYNYRDRIVDLKQKYVSLNKENLKILGVSLIENEIDINLITTNYKDKINDFIKENKVKIIEYPDLSLQDITIRRLERKKPFKTDGDGFRDFIIWECLKRQINSWGETVAFLSNNSTDFGQAPKLFGELEDEIKNNLHKFKYYNSLYNFNKDNILPRLNSIENLLGRLKDNKIFDFDLYHWLQTNIKDIIYDNEVGTFALCFEKDGKVWPSKIDEIEDINILTIKEMSGNDILISFSAKVKVIFSIHVDWEDYCNCDGIKNYFGETEYFESMFTSYEDIITIYFSLIYNTDEKEVWSEELDGFDSEYGHSERFNSWSNIPPHLP